MASPTAQAPKIEILESSSASLCQSPSFPYSQSVTKFCWFCPRTLTMLFHLPFYSYFCGPVIGSLQLTFPPFYQSSHFWKKKEETKKEREKGRERERKKRKPRILCQHSLWTFPEFSCLQNEIQIQWMVIRSYLIASPSASSSSFPRCSLFLTLSSQLMGYVCPALGPLNHTITINMWPNNYLKV